MSKRKILIVEDNEDNMKLFRWLLEDEGYEVIEAGCAEVAFQQLDQTEVDAVIMDISLPGMNGKEATRQLRGEERFARLPILAATAHAIKEESDAILASGVNDLITKPVDEESLLDKLAQLCAGV